MLGVWKNNGRFKCPHCKSTRLRKEGIVRKKQRYLCKSCGRYTIIPYGARR